MTESTRYSAVLLLIDWKKFETCISFELVIMRVEDDRYTSTLTIRGNTGHQLINRLAAMKSFSLAHQQIPSLSIYLLLHTLLTRT